jgi:hypothetical protein
MIGWKRKVIAAVAVAAGGASALAGITAAHAEVTPQTRVCAKEKTAHWGRIQGWCNYGGWWRAVGTCTRTHPNDGLKMYGKWTKLGKSKIQCEGQGGFTNLKEIKIEKG